MRETVSKQVINDWNQRCDFKRMKSTAQRTCQPFLEYNEKGESDERGDGDET